MNSFAIIPAAGRGLRMGPGHKLLMRWNQETVIDQVLRAWCGSRATRVVIVVRRDDLELQAACRRWPDVEVVMPEIDPVDMKQSVQFGLIRISEVFSPEDSDRWMVAPADLPTLTTPLIDQVIDGSCGHQFIVAPRFGNRRGHPVSFPWPISAEVFRLHEDQGINGLLDARTVRYVEFREAEYPADIDTAEDYEQLANRQSQA